MAKAYSVDTENRGDVEVVVLRQDPEATAELVPLWGNNCISFRVGEPILESVPFEGIRQKPTSYGIPLLFPFPNRIRDGVFRFEGVEYRPEPPRHGFVRDKPWRIVDRGATPESGAWVTSTLDAGDHPDDILRHFPFPFRLEVTHRLRDHALEIVAVATNRGDRPMPAGFGIHPYFEKPERGTVVVPARRRWELADSLPTGKRVEVDSKYDLRRPRNVAELELDDIYTDLEAEGGSARCVLEDHDRSVRTVIQFSAAELPEVVVYTPPQPRRAICIEPNSCPTDAFNLAERGIDSHVVRLGAGEKASWRISIRAESRH